MRILCVLPSWIGDAVMVSGALAALTDRHPEARLTLAVGPAAAGLFADWPRVDEIIILKKRPYAGHWFGLWAKTVARRWDVVMDVRGSGLAYGLWAGTRYVYRRQDRFQDLHKTWETGSLLGLDQPLLPKVSISEARREHAARLTAGEGPILAVAPMANWVGKTWPLDHYITLVKRLLRLPELEGARLMTVGGPADQGVCDSLQQAVLPEQRLQLAGQVDLLTSTACLAHARLYVGNDSGPTHLAAMAGAPTLALYGPTNDKRYGPPQAQARIVRTKRDYEWYQAQGAHLGDDTLWMLDLDVATVERAALSLLEETTPTPTPELTHV